MNEQKIPCNCGRSVTGYCLGQQVLTARPPEGHLGAWIPPCDYDLAQKAIESASESE
jgi:hypothetical protein